MSTDTQQEIYEQTRRAYEEVHRDYQEKKQQYEKSLQRALQAESKAGIERKRSESRNSVFSKSKESKMVDKE